VVREAAAMTVGDAVRLRLWKGALDCRVEGISGVEGTEERVK